MKATISKAQAILRYFRFSHQTLGDFQKELKELSPQEELELAQGAARELGYTAEQCKFPQGAA